MRNKDLEWLALRCDDMKGAKYISREGNHVSLTSKPYNHGESYTHGEWWAARRELGLDKTLDSATPAEWTAASRAARDLKWLAENVNEWADGATGVRRDEQEGWYAFVYGDCNSDDREWFTKSEWLMAKGDSEDLDIARERMSDESVPVTVDELRKSVSDGSTASYYELPPGCTELQDLISYRNLNAQDGEIFRAIYRKGRASHSDELRDARKVLFYAKAEVERLEKLCIG